MAASNPLWKFLFIFCQLWVSFFAERITDKDFRFGNEKQKIVIYRLLGNDMPPGEDPMQQIWNTNFTLRYEPNFHGVQKRWILNRIWNETTFDLMYTLLVQNGVHRRDIISRCFDKAAYSKQGSFGDKMIYLTSQNEARNAGLKDGRESGFEWTIVLDGSTFITQESWEKLYSALQIASKEGKKYFKIPYHRIRGVQDPSWLNGAAKANNILTYAPMKGESQIAFHRSSTEFFSLGDTNPEGSSDARKGYGHQNKAYLFDEDAICGPNSKSCGCSHMSEVDANDLKAKSSTQFLEYFNSCGLVLRLWNFPTANLASTGLSEKDEEGFYCYLEKVRSEENYETECEVFNKAAAKWKDMSTKDRTSYRGSKAIDCKIKFRAVSLFEPCFRSHSKDVAMKNAAAAIEALPKSTSSHSLCANLRPPPDDPRRQHYLTVFDHVTLQKEKAAWKSGQGVFYNSINTLLTDLIHKADRGISLGPYSVTYKRRHPSETKDKHFYLSMRPYFWLKEDLPKELEDQVNSGKIKLDKRGYLHRDGFRAPGTVIGAADGDDLYDRSSAWYMVDNVTTLALAWFFTDEDKYAKKAVQLVDVWFLDPKTAMYPNLDYSQDGERTGPIDWKDVYYLLDAITLLEQSKLFVRDQVKAMRKWCAKLAHWLVTSRQGMEEGWCHNNHALYLDLSTVSLALYAGDDDLVDTARSRLFYRLSKPAPKGHFSLDGGQPEETTRPTALHYVTFNLIGWVHVAQLVEAARKHSEKPGSFMSLWAVKHESEIDDPKALPVLCKAIRWISQFLPRKVEVYYKFTEPTQGMGVDFPYSQADHYAFSRLLEIVHYGVLVYGIEGIFPQKHLPEPASLALNHPLYTTDFGSFSKFSSVDPDSGARVWTALGLPYAHGQES